MMQFLSRFFGSIRSFWQKHKSFAKYVLNELLGGAIYRMEDRVFDSAYNSIKESIILNSENSNIYACVMHGEREDFNPCCIDFFTRCIILDERPVDHGGMFSPDVEGYVLCPSCAAFDYPDLYFSSKLEKYEVSCEQWMQSCFADDAFEKTPALAWMVMEWIYNRMKNGESILSIKRDFPFMSEEDIRYAAYFYEQEKQEEKEE